MLQRTRPQINAERLWASLMTLAQIGATARGGVARLALTDLDRQARDQVRRWFIEAGCEIRTDAIGNLFAIRPGRRGNGLDHDGHPSRDPSHWPVAVGSHIDTQPSGGKFDGNYGVLAGLEVMRTLGEAGIETERPVLCAIWTNEEGSRFTPVMMGSGIFAGAFTLEHVLAQRDRDGTTVAQALDAIGDAGAHPAPRLAAYFEPHIEQGPILEACGAVIGVVEGALGQRWFDVTVIGQDAHAGPTPLAMRRDALLAAADLVREVRAIAREHPDDARGTVGQLVVSPNSRNVIPGRVDLTVDLRNARAETLTRMVDALSQTCERLQTEHGVQISLREVVHFEPCAFDVTLTDRVESCAQARQLPTRRLSSGAGHDAVYVARTCPTAMIFVPCEGGISHNEIENAQPAHLAAGCDVLLDCLLQTAQQP